MILLKKITKLNQYLPHKLTWTLSSRSPTMIACPWRPQCRTRTMARAWWTPRTKRSRPAQLRHRSTAPGPSARQGESHQQANRRVATFLFRSVSRPRRKFQIGRRRVQNRERSKTSSVPLSVALIYGDTDAGDARCISSTL